MTFFPRKAFDVRANKPFAFKEAIAVNPIGDPFRKRERSSLFFRVALYPPRITFMHPHVPPECLFLVKDISKHYIENE